MSRRQGYDFHTAFYLQLKAFDLEEEGRLDEAIALYRRAAAMGDISANLPRLLTDKGGDDWAEGVLWYRRMLRAGDPSGAWNLAMVYRQQGNRRRYLSWMRRAARMGDEDAIVLLAEIEHRQAARQVWPMFVKQVLDADDAIWVLDDLRKGVTTLESVTVWAGRAARGEIAPQTEDDTKGRLASVLAELADPARDLTRQRALELIYKLS